MLVTVMTSSLLAVPRWLSPRLKERVHLNAESSLSLLLPVAFCYYAMSVLALVPSTRTYRLALLVPALLSTWSAATRLDISGGKPELNHNNYGYCVSPLFIFIVGTDLTYLPQVVMFTFGMRMLDWALLSEPLTRPSKHANTFTAVLDLCCNLRGIGWTWSKGLRLPPETRPTHSRCAFAASTLLRALRDMFIFDAFQATLQHLAPTTFGSLAGGTIFDAGLPPPARYLRAALVTLLAATGIYFSLSMMYHLATVLAFALSFAMCGALPDPAEWPPISDAPWAATSLGDFWSRRWHQAFRHAFVRLGYRPGRAVAGRVGGVLGAFTLSAVMHDICIWAMGRGTDFRKIGGFFLLNGVGVALEHIFERVAGRRVGGVGGWVWTMVFLLTTGSLMVDAWLMRGFIGSVVIPEPLRPTRLITQLLL